MSTIASTPPPVTTLRRATTTMAVGTLLSRLTGVGRIVALGYALGTGLTNASPADAYNLSNTIPNIVQDLVLGGILSATFIPVFVARLATRDEDEAWEAISAVVSVTLVVLGAASVVFLAAAPFIVDGLTVLRHTPGERTVATYLLILFVPQLACYTFAALAAALLNARGRFGAPTFAPIANNVITIVVLLAFAGLDRHPTLAGLEANRGELILLGLGTTAGVAVQALLLIPSLQARRPAAQVPSRLSPRGRAHDHQALGLDLRARRREPDRSFGRARSVRQDPRRRVRVHVLVRLLPVAVRGGGHLGDERCHARSGRALGATRPARFPQTMVTRTSRDPRDRASGRRRRAHPRKTFVAVLIGYHASNPASTTPTAQALAMLALGLPGFCVFLYTIRGFQAMQSLRTAFWLYVVENGINVALAIVLVGPLGIRGVALSISVAYTVCGV